MRRLLLAAAVTVALGLLSGSARAAAPNRDVPGPDAVSPSARSYEVVNASTGEVLAAHNAHEQLPIASLTKLMTVIVALQHVQPDQIVTVSKRTANVGGSRIPLRGGQQISVEDLLKGALIQSANNAADTLAVRRVGRRHSAVRRRG